MCIWSELKDGIVFTKVANDIDFDLVSNKVRSSDTLIESTGIYAELIDLSECDSVDLNSNEMVKLTGLIEDAFEKFEKSFVAVYAPNDYVYGITSMMQNYAVLNDSSARVETFRDKEKALNWLEHCVSLAKFL